MSEPHPLMALLLDHNSFLGKSEEIENTIMPIPDQLAFGPGDAALLASANTPLERDFVVAKCLDPEKHKETWPDWEERLLNSYVLCELFSTNDPEISVGWVSRLKILPISNYRYRECRRWLKNGFPEEMPKWATEHYLQYTDALADNAPETVPRSAECPNCKSHDVEMIVVRRITYSGRVGRLQHDDREVFVPVTEPDVEQSHTARLHCTNCDSGAELTDEEWILPGTTN